MSIVATGSDASSLRSASSKRRGDATFKAITLLAGALVFVLLGAIAVFLVVKAIPALQADKSSFWTTQIWDPDGTVHFGIAALAFGTLLTSFMALVMAVPVALGVSLYVTQYAPRRVATYLGYATDMLAAVPSVVYGLWGIFYLLPHLIGTQVFLSKYFGWIPLFSDKNNLVSSYSKSVFGASVVLAIMTLPIIAAISREIFRQVDPAQREAALARWGLPSAVLGAVGLTFLLFAFTGFQGTVDFIVVAAILAIAAVSITSWAVEGRRRAKDRLATSAALFFLVLTLTPLAFVIGYTIKLGLERFNLNFLTHSMAGVSPLSSNGGIYHAIIGTLEQVLIASAMAIPLGLLVAIYVTEYAGGMLATAIRFLIDVMTGIPSIVAGLFFLAFLVLALGPAFIGVAGGLAVAL